MRLFLSISLPENVKEELYKNCLLIQKNCFTIPQHHVLKWPGKEQLHITQYFLGNINETILPEVMAAAKKCISDSLSFNLSSEKICWFPEEGPSPKMIWLKFHEHKTFSELSASLYNSLRTLIPDLDQPQSPSIPHVTLIRLKKVKPFNRELGQLNPIEIPVTRIELWQSFLNEKGAKYKSVGVFPLES